MTDDLENLDTLMRMCEQLQENQRRKLFYFYSYRFYFF